MERTMSAHLRQIAALPALPLPATIPPDIPLGDTPGDKVGIYDTHIQKANVLLPALLKLVANACDESPCGRCVVGVCGGSGAGKSGTAALLGWYLNQLGAPSYILSGDNYPRRLPAQNDAERLRLFRNAGIQALLQAGLYTGAVRDSLRELMQQDRDADTARCATAPWLATYQQAGRRALADYLGTSQEIDYEQLNHLLDRFHAGAATLALRRLGRTPDVLWYDTVDFSDTAVLILEWTHSNSDALQGVDIPILLDSTPEATLPYRMMRNRDNRPDSPFIAMVLSIEQTKLNEQARKARLILSQDNRLLTYPEFQQQLQTRN